MWKHVRHHAHKKTCNVDLIKDIHFFVLCSFFNFFLNVCAPSPEMYMRSGQQSREKDASYMVEPRDKGCKQQGRAWKKGCCSACTAVGRLAGSQ